MQTLYRLNDWSQHSKEVMYEQLEWRIENARNMSQQAWLLNAMLYTWMIPLHNEPIPLWFSHALADPPVSRNGLKQRPSIMGQYMQIAPDLRKGFFETRTLDSLLLLDVWLRGIIGLLLLRDQLPNHVDDVCTLMPLMDDLLRKIDRAPPNEEEVEEEMLFYAEHFKNTEKKEEGDI